MLNKVIRNKELFFRGTAYLFFISCITFQTLAFADITEKTAEEYRTLGYAEQQKGNLNEALSYYTKATTIGLHNPVLYNDMGVLYEEIDMNLKAEQYYLLAIQTDSRYLPAYINLAYLYQRLGRDEDAALYFKRRYELGNPNDPWAQKAKTELLKINPAYEQWVNALEAESLNKQLEANSRKEFHLKVRRSKKFYKNGKDHFKDGKYKDAIREYNLALQLAPKNKDILRAKDMALLEIAKESVRNQSEQALKRLEMGDTVSARHEIQKILPTIPSEPILISR